MVEQSFQTLSVSLIFVVLSRMILQVHSLGDDQDDKKKTLSVVHPKLSHGLLHLMFR